MSKKSLEMIGMMSGGPVHQEGDKLWQYLATSSGRKTFLNSYLYLLSS